MQEETKAVYKLKCIDCRSVYIGQPPNTCRLVLMNIRGIVGRVNLLLWFLTIVSNFIIVLILRSLESWLANPD